MLLPCYLHPRTAPPTLPQILSGSSKVMAASSLCKETVITFQPNCSSSRCSGKAESDTDDDLENLAGGFRQPETQTHKFPSSSLRCYTGSFFESGGGVLEGAKQPQKYVCVSICRGQPIFTVRCTHTQTEERPAHISTLTFIITNHLWRGICC